MSVDWAFTDDSAAPSYHAVDWVPEDPSDPDGDHIPTIDGHIVPSVQRRKAK